MANRGKNSLKHNERKNQEYLARTYVFRWAYQDKLIRETVSKSSKDAIEKELLKVCKQLCYHPDNDMLGMVLLSQLDYAFYENALPPVPNLKNGES